MQTDPQTISSKFVQFVDFKFYIHFALKCTKICDFQTEKRKNFCGKGFSPSSDPTSLVPET